MKRFRTKQIKWYEKESQLNESIKSGPELAFVSPNFEQSTPFFRCKDYLQDAVFNFLNKSDKKLYGFQYDPAVDPPLSFDKTRIIATNSLDFDMSFRIEGSLDFLNQLEKQLKMQPTKIFRCQEPPLKYIRPDVWLYSGSNRWMNSPPMISMYGLMIRVSMNHKLGTDFQKTINGIIDEKIEPIQAVDQFRLKQSIDGIEKIIKIGDRRLFFQRKEDNYPSNLTLSSVHNKLGIVSFSLNFSEKFIPYWHRKIE
jgi:hypothetical protein